jgi:hypothetical protein
VVFVTTRDSVEMHHLLLTEYPKATGDTLTPHPVLKLHGSMDPVERTGETLHFMITSPNSQLPFYAETVWQHGCHGTDW